MALLICVELGSMVPGNKLVERMARMGSPVEDKESFHITHFPSTSLTIFNLIG
uniref:AlNc14C173G8051 protein n=1 Tax=Albugo laibachii Nc14 TaxID=890382 RepID=F0WNN0_9STRA|nr:AlNc14C173G8051 [Albugo laibachii Nc14]|eukprot:CCA22921.1 AlNc14C173G8051 [Albugo laibachii Nc14]